MPLLPQWATREQFAQAVDDLEVESAFYLKAYEYKVSQAANLVVDQAEAYLQHASGGWD